MYNTMNLKWGSCIICNLDISESNLEISRIREENILKLNRETKDKL